MGVPGETDLAKMLESLTVERRPGVFTYVELGSPPVELSAVAHATVVEGDVCSLVVQVDVARRAGLPVEIELGWLTLTVQSSLEAVGLTAAFSARLAEQGIPCNVLAGYRHDHILVPVDRVDDAVTTLTTPSG